MKVRFILSLVLLPIVCSAQLINANLDEWAKMYNLPFESPLGWRTTNSVTYGLSISVSKEAREEGYMARIESNAPGTDAVVPGRLWQTISATNLKSIEFLAKCDSLSGKGTCRIILKNPDDNLIVYIQDIEQEMEDFEILKIDNLNDIITSEMIEIIFIANGSQFYPDPENDGYSIFFVDEVVPNYTTNNEQIRIEEMVKVFPNPTDGLFQLDINSDLEPKTIEINTITGSLIYKGKYERAIDLSDFTNGIYLLKIATKEGIITKKIVLQK